MAIPKQQRISTRLEKVCLRLYHNGYGELTCVPICFLPNVASSTFSYFRQAPTDEIPILHDFQISGVIPDNRLQITKRPRQVLLEA
ncbi:hypothetical protein Pla100_06630 [Neorhodopirellula pilleata]|uniref:Uncharacterized protein n=1 Tax=Neorhodopirellula pilleata TaxID=2714738 RepID=A0A5C6AUP3_9BACT|nr:hypothetical protein Pla100_06630 [Neorhodopirellula pilleata]